MFCAPQQNEGCNQTCQLSSDFNNNHVKTSEREPSSTYVPAPKDFTGTIPPRGMMVSAQKTAAADNNITEKSFFSFLSRSSLSPSACSRNSSGIFCRICHEGDGMENLVSPCQCSGSMALVHKSCIEKWLSTANNDTCELCRHKYTVARHPRPFRDWICTPAIQEDQRNLVGDIICFCLLTPLAGISTYLCATGAKFYYDEKRSESVGLISLSVILVLIYLVWVVLTLKYHFQVWYSWRDTHQDIRLLDIGKKPVQAKNWRNAKKQNKQESSSADKEKRFSNEKEQQHKHQEGNKVIDLDITEASYYLEAEGSNRKAFVVSPRHLKNTNHTSSPRHGHHSCSKSMIHLKTSCSSQLPSVAAARGGQDCIKNFDVADTKFDLSNRRKDQLSTSFYTPMVSTPSHHLNSTYIASNILEERATTPYLPKIKAPPPSPRAPRANRQAVNSKLPLTPCHNPKMLLTPGPPKPPRTSLSPPTVMSTPESSKPSPLTEKPALSISSTSRTWTVITTSPSSQTLSVPLPGSVPVSSVPLPDESVPELTLSVPVVPSATLSITPTEQMIQNYTSHQQMSNSNLNSFGKPSVQLTNPLLVKSPFAAPRMVDHTSAAPRMVEHSSAEPYRVDDNSSDYMEASSKL